MNTTQRRNSSGGAALAAVVAAGLASLGTSEACDTAWREEGVEVDASGPVELRYRAEGTEPSFPVVNVRDLAEGVTLEVVVRRDGGPGADAGAVGGMTVAPEEAQMTVTGGSYEERLELSKCESAACERYGFVVALRLTSGEQTTVDLHVAIENSGCTSNDSSLKITRLP